MQCLYSHFHGSSWRLPDPLANCTKLARTEVLCYPADMIICTCSYARKLQKKDCVCNVATVLQSLLDLVPGNFTVPPGGQLSVELTDI